MPSYRQFLRKTLSGALPNYLFMTSGRRIHKSIYLTFDDGPDEEHTPRLLDALAAAGITATFFLVGRQAERHPGIVRRIVADGHAIGHHSFTHSEPSATSGKQLLCELARTRTILLNTIGLNSRLFRPPHGKLTPGKLVGLWMAGQTVVLWSQDPRDFACRTSQEALRYFHQNPPRAGDVLLMHDNHPHAAQLLPDLVKITREADLTFSTIPQWIAKE